MRSVLTCLLFFILFSRYAHAQHIDGVPLDSIDVPYMEMIVRGSPVPNMITIDLDYGQAPRLHHRIATLRNDSDEPEQFNSVMDALAFMHKHNYELFEVYVTGETAGYLNYILKRKATEE